MKKQNVRDHITNAIYENAKGSNGDHKQVELNLLFALKELQK